MSKEIGGYLELEKNSGSMLYSSGIKLNCGRNALAYLIESNQIKEIWIPFFICDCITNICEKYHVKINRYHIDEKFRPILKEISKVSWLYVVNFYGQIQEGQISIFLDNFKNVIVDNAHAYFQKPIEKAHTIYTCRKFFGVSDGAILYTNNLIKREIKVDESYNRLNFVLGRYERKANEFYLEASSNNDLFDLQDIKYMSKITENILNGINYENVKNRRTINYMYLYYELKDLNELDLKVIEGAYMYPLLIKDSAYIKEKLYENKIYIPVLWPNVVKENENNLEYRFASHILPIPCDQRYDLEDMNRIIKIIKEKIK